MATEFADFLLRARWTTVTAWTAGVVVLLSLVYLITWQSYKLHAFYRRQNVMGPGYRPFFGNLMEIWSLQGRFARMKRQPAHPADVVLRNMPHLSHWSKLYGSVFTYMQGSKVNLCVLDTDIIREILVSKADCYRRSPAGRFWRYVDAAARSDKAHSKTAELMNHCEPQRWSTVRKIFGPKSHQDIAQGNLQTTIDHCKGLVYRWDLLLDETSRGDGRVEVEPMRDISKTSMHILLTNLIGSTLSSNDLEKVDSILDNENDEIVKVTPASFSSHFCSSRSSRDGWLNQLFTDTAQSRFGTFQAQDAKDLVDLMVSLSQHLTAKEGVQQVVSDCNMMLAAQKSTTFLIYQTLLLLARHTTWQDHARAEVLNIRPLSPVVDDEGDGGYISYPNLAKLKILNMILNESLRLWPPIICIEKQCQKRHRLGKYKVLPGTFVEIPLVLLHHSHELWGEDSLAFRPQRFEQGRSRKPVALLPFSAGPSVCLGFNFALQEAKFVLVSLLSNFSFRLARGSVSNPVAYPLLTIRKLKVDDFAQATREKLVRWRSSIL